MDNQQLMPGEEILMQSDDLTITLTNFRIRYYETQMGNASLVSMHLEKLSAIEMTYKSNLILFYLGIIAVVGGIVMGMYGRNDSMFGSGIVLGIVLMLIYWLTRKHIVSISSDSGLSINFQTSGMNSDKHIQFINKIETAKHNFISRR